MPSDNSSEFRSEWTPWLERLEQLREQSLQMGGSESLQKHQYSKGKLDVRQRVAALCDRGTFSEIGALVGHRSEMPADGFVCGFGRVNGRLIAVGAEDFTIKAGTVGGGGGAKRYRIAELALQEGVPMVWIKEGAGARMVAREKGGGAGATRVPNDLEAMADLKGRVPVVCLVLGVSAGHGALAAPMADFVVMTKRASLFTGGPDLVRAATGEDIDAVSLGGWETSVVGAGTVHNVVDDDLEAIALARHYLTYFGQNVSEAPPRAVGVDSGPRSCDDLLDIIPPNSKTPYDVRRVITAIADDHEYFEIQPLYGRAASVGFAHIGGRAVAIVANNPAFQAGALDAAAAIKCTDMIQLADTFGHPVIFLLDNPGVMAGSDAERDGVLKWGGRMYIAGRRLRSPKISVLMRKGFGFGLVTMAHMPFDNQTLVLALAGANIATMPAQSGGKTANIDDETRSKMEAAQKGGPYGLANSLGVDMVIDPRELRNVLMDGLAMTESRPPRSL